MKIPCGGFGMRDCQNHAIEYHTFRKNSNLSSESHVSLVVCAFCAQKSYEFDRGRNDAVTSYKKLIQPTIGTEETIAIEALVYTICAM